jgi:hypothetical protein
VLFLFLNIFRAYGKEKKNVSGTKPVDRITMHLARFHACLSGSHSAALPSSGLKLAPALNSGYQALCCMKIVSEITF